MWRSWKFHSKSKEILKFSERASKLGYIETKCAPQSESHVGFLKSVLSGYFAIVVQEIIAKKFHELLITLFQTAHILHPPQAGPVLFCSVIMSHHFWKLKDLNMCILCCLKPNILL